MFIRIMYSTYIKMGFSRVSRATGGIEVYAITFSPGNKEECAWSQSPSWTKYISGEIPMYIYGKDKVLLWSDL